MIAHRMTGASDAPVVLYLHGLGIAGWCWEPIAEKLPDFAALMPDFPGHGGSASIPWVSIADTAARVGALVDSLPGDRPVHVTGHSLGAYVGTVLIASRPQRFRSAVLSGFHVGEIGSKLMLKFAYAANGLVFRIPPLLRRFARMFGDGAMAARFVEGAKLIGAGTIRRAGMQVVDFRSPFGAGELEVPTLAIAADGEPVAIRTTPATLERQFETVRGMVLEGRDHLWPMKEPALYADLLAAHVRAHP